MESNNRVAADGCEDLGDAARLLAAAERNRYAET
jgi:hypothetical protein